MQVAKCAFTLVVIVSPDIGEHHCTVAASPTRAVKRL